MAYDAVSNRTVLADSTGRYSTLYDSLNRARAVTNPAQLTISYGFDAAGRRAWMVEPSGGRFTYGYSPTDFNTLVINPQGERTTWQFDAASRVTVQRLANLIRVSYAYDDADRLVRLANLTSTGTTITSYRDTWDPANNRLARIEHDGTLVTWSYDPTYQLTRERRNGANSYDTTYAYDPAGNRRLKLDNSIRTTYSYDAANQLNTYVDNTGTTTFGFDASGNQRIQLTPSSGTTTNTWDYENRLTIVTSPSRVLCTFSYCDTGMRVAHQDASGSRKSIWDNEKILEETDQDNTAQVIYTQSSGIYGDAVSQRQDGATNYLLFDPLGSTTRVTDGTGSVKQLYLFKAFGDILVSAGTSSTVFQFGGRVGYYVDTAISALYVRSRHYAWPIGRFVVPDPSGFGDGANWYLYALNNAPSTIDPSGLQSTGGLITRCLGVIPFLPPVLDVRPWRCSLVDSYEIHAGDGQCLEGYYPLVGSNATWCVKCSGPCPEGMLCREYVNADGIREQPACGCTGIPTIDNLGWPVGETCKLVGEKTMRRDAKASDCPAGYVFVQGRPNRCIACFGLCYAPPGSSRTCDAYLVPMGPGKRDKAVCECTLRGIA